MEQILLVRRLLEQGMAEVSPVPENTCGGNCRQCSGCGAAQAPRIFRAYNPINARPGDVVRAEVIPSFWQKAATALYLLPVLLLPVGYLVGENMWGKGILVGLATFAISMVPVRCLNRHLNRKLVYTITEFAGKDPC